MNSIQTKSDMTTNRICVVGAGLVGSLLSIFLAKRGFSVDVFEKRPDIRNLEVNGGRTVAMSISRRGWTALEKVGLKEKILPNTVPKTSRMVHLEDGSCTRQEYGMDGQAIFTINRKYLNITLVEEAEKYGVKFYFNRKCHHINYDTGEIDFLNDQFGDIENKKYDKIIGSDGIFSEVAKGIINQPGGYHDVYSLEHGYKELLIDADEKGDWRMPKGFVHIWPRGNSNLVALPNVCKTFTCTLFLNFNGEVSMESLQDPTNIQKFFNSNFQEIIKYVPNYVDQFLETKVSSIFSLKCGPWNFKNKVLVVGDAAHAITPFFAMGMNVGFEDCSVFDTLMDVYNDNLDLVFENFTQARKPDTDAIYDMSLENFKALSKCDDDNYDLKWKLNRKLWAQYPKVWMPLYPMIAFSNIKLSEIQQINERQEAIINHILKNEGSVSLSDNSIKYLYEKYIKNAEYLMAS